MLQQMPAEAAYCYERVSDCAEKAQEAHDERSKQTSLIWKRWQILGQSYQFPERATLDIPKFAVRKWRALAPDNNPPSDPNGTGARWRQSPDAEFIAPKPPKQPQ